MCGPWSKSFGPLSSRLRSGGLCLARLSDKGVSRVGECSLACKTKTINGFTRTDKVSGFASAIVLWVSGLEADPVGAEESYALDLEAGAISQEGRAALFTAGVQRRGGWRAEEGPSIQHSALKPD